MALVIEKGLTKEEILNSIQHNAEELFRSGTYYCSEAVLQTINEFLGKPYSEDVVKLASGFPIGMGRSGCLCGAVSGGQMALGIAYGRVEGEPMKEKMFEKSKDLHDFTKDKYKSTCCRVITKKWVGDNFADEDRKKLCIEITGVIARWVANELIEDGQVNIK